MTDPTGIDIQTDPTRKTMSGIATHGNTRFTCEVISEIEPGLHQGGCQSGLILPPSITDVVSLYKWERYSVRHELSSFVEVTMYDGYGAVDPHEVDALARWVNTRRNRGGVVLVHCQAGLNRSSLIVAVSLAQRYGISGDEAIERIRAARSTACLCNPDFEHFVRQIKAVG